MGQVAAYGGNFQEGVGLRPRLVRIPEAQWRVTPPSGNCPVCCGRKLHSRLPGHVSSLQPGPQNLGTAGGVKGSPEDDLLSAISSVLGHRRSRSVAETVSPLSSGGGRTCLLSRIKMGTEEAAIKLPWAWPLGRWCGGPCSGAFLNTARTGPSWSEVHAHPQGLVQWLDLSASPCPLTRPVLAPSLPGPTLGSVEIIAREMLVSRTEMGHPEGRA